MTDFFNRDKADAETAIAAMNGEWLGSRAIRVNWANQKTQTGGSRSLGGMGGPGGFSNGGGGGGNGAMGGGGSNTPLTFEQVAAQTPEYNATVYVGNLIPYTTQADLIPLFQNFGYIVEIRMQADRGFAFVKLDTHANAANAITSLQTQQHLIHGRPIKCSWGKDRQSEGQSYLIYPSNYSYYPGPGFGGIPGQPGASPATPDGNVNANVSANGNGNGAGPWDPSAAAGGAYFHNAGTWGTGFYGGELKHT